MLTADTITNEQIRSLRQGRHIDKGTYEFAIQLSSSEFMRRHYRARCAEILNALFSTRDRKIAQAALCACGHARSTHAKDAPFGCLAGMTNILRRNPLCKCESFNAIAREAK